MHLVDHECSRPEGQIQQNLDWLSEAEVLVGKKQEKPLPNIERGIIFIIK